MAQARIQISWTIDVDMEKYRKGLDEILDDLVEEIENGDADLNEITDPMNAGEFTAGYTILER